MKIYNLVFCTHENSHRQFLFQAPLTASLHKGDEVFVDTKRGKQRATVASENFCANKGLMTTIAHGCGGYIPLAFVTGKAETRVVETPLQENEEEDTLPF